MLANPGLFLWLFAVLTVTAALFGHKVGFDYNLLHMQDPKLDSIKMEVSLANQGNSVVMCAVSVVDDLDQARVMSAKLSQLDTVARVESVLPLVPPQLKERAPYVEKLVRLTRRLPKLDFAPIEGEQGLTDLQTTIERVDSNLSALLPQLLQDQALAPQARKFQHVWKGLERRAERMGPGEIEESLGIFQKATQDDLDRMLTLLREQTDVPPSLKQVPEPLRIRALGTTGKILLRVVPKKSTWDRPALEKFVTSLQKVDPKITGDPVLMWHFNYLISETYSHVGWYTYAAVFTLLLLYFRRPLAAILTLLPISLSLIWMLALMRASEISFNPANFIALPMLVGIGASFGMQVVARAWEEGAEAMLSFSTGPAVIFSALMAMSGFGSLLFSAHVGVRSLGFIVTAAVAANLLASLVLLPAVIRLVRRQRRLRATTSARTGE